MSHSDRFWVQEGSKFGKKQKIKYQVITCFPLCVASRPSFVSVLNLVLELLCHDLCMSDVAYSEPCQTSKMEVFAKTANG